MYNNSKYNINQFYKTIKLYTLIKTVSNSSQSIYRQCNTNSSTYRLHKHNLLTLNNNNKRLNQYK